MFIITVTLLLLWLLKCHATTAGNPFQSHPESSLEQPWCFERMSRLVSTVQASVLSKDSPIHPEHCTPKEVQIPSPTTLITQELFYLSGHDT